MTCNFFLKKPNYFLYCPNVFEGKMLFLLIVQHVPQDND